MKLKEINMKMNLAAITDGLRNDGGIIPVPELIEHAERIADYLWRSEAADEEFRARFGTSQPHIYDSVVVLERWIDQQRTLPERFALLPRPSVWRRGMEYTGLVGYLLGILTSALFLFPLGLR